MTASRWPSARPAALTGADALLIAHIVRCAGCATGAVRGRGVLSATRSPSQMTRPARHATLLVGRESDLQRLRQGIGAARAGRADSAVLTGEGGIGKSRLLNAAAAAARDAGVVVLPGRAVSRPPDSKLPAAS